MVWKCSWNSRFD